MPLTDWWALATTLLPTTSLLHFSLLPLEPHSPVHVWQELGHHD